MGDAPGAAAVLVPCTCGELVQGVVGGEPFLVSCPIDCYSRVAVTLDAASPSTIAAPFTGAPRQDVAAPFTGAPAAGVKPAATTDDRPADVAAPFTGAPRGREARGYDNGPPPKALRAALATLRLLGHERVPLTLRVSCPLPPSKGFGSSTADVAGAIVATAAALGASLTPQEVARLAVSVEPSDGTMFPGLALFNHRDGGRWEPLGPAPPLWVVVLDFQGAVDTLDYNARLDLARLRALEPDHAEALGLLRRGLRERRPELVGRAATLSAGINQRLLPKPQLEEVIALGRGHGALGVCAAHSGTALGVLFAPDEREGARRFLAEARAGLRGLDGCWISRMVDGGARTEPGSA